jgi:hypothetical protein
VLSLELHACFNVNGKGMCRVAGTLALNIDLRAAAHDLSQSMTSIK